MAATVTDVRTIHTDSESSIRDAHAIHHLFERQADKTPDSVAVAFGANHLTYGELNQKANQLAHYLCARGVGPNVLVGLHLTRSLEMIIGLLGILKAGGAYVPLDPTYPDQRIAAMIADSQLNLLLSLDSLAQEIEPPLPELICLDVDWSLIENESIATPDVTTTPDDLLYVIYTSGSTGKPKGVMLPHRALSNLIAWQLDNSVLQPGARTLQFTSLSFDVSCQEIFATLCSGGELVLIAQAERRDFTHLADFIAQQQIERIFLPFIALQQLALQLVKYDSDLLALKEIITAGEQLKSSNAIVALFEHLPQCTLYNQYGPSETHVATAYKLPPDPANWPPLPPIGRPVANTQLYILDSQQRPLPVGEPGELYIGGAGVAHGYLNQPELSAERFIRNPFAANDQGYLYKTGDMVRQLPDGNIEFLGRQDRQVKIRGYRVELGEIEAILNQHPDLKAVAVIDHEYAPGDRRLVAYVVPQDIRPIAVSDLRHFVGRKLPDYMIPSTFTVLDALPQTPSGKLDRKSLPAPVQTQFELDETYVAPRNPIEKTLAAIWAEVIGVPRVGIDDNYLELGGDSILSIQITSKAEQSGIYLVPNQSLEHPTIAQLAKVAHSKPLFQAEQGLITGSLPLTPIQHWFFEKNLPDPHHWNQAFVLEVDKSVDPDRLSLAVKELLRHHDALRLRFTKTEAGWQQTVALPDDSVPFSVVDLSGLQAAEQKAAFVATATELQASLDLMQGPLMRVAWVDCGPNQPNRLLMIINHQAIEGVSWRILFEHLTLLCRDDNGQEPVQLPAKTTSYKQWSHRLAAYAQEQQVRRELSFWLEMREKQPARLPVDYRLGTANNSEISAETISISLDATTTQTLLKEAPKAYQTQINDILLTALTTAFTRWTGNPTQLFDLEGHGREALFADVDLSRTVGWFTAIFPVMLRLDQSSPPGEKLKAVKEQLRAIPHRGIHYGILRYLSNDTTIAEKLRTLPQAEISFNYLGQFDQMLPSASPFKLTSDFYGPRHSPRGQRPYLLEIEGGIVNGQLQLSWIYSRDSHRRATIEALADDFMETLEKLIAHCQSPDAGGYTPSDFPEVELSQEELDNLLAELLELED